MNAENAWIDFARRDFLPGKRSDCEVCKKYACLTQAHHLTPLSLQSRQPDVPPDQSFVWLCPTHHVAVHILWAQYVSARVSAGPSQIRMIAELPIEEFRVLLGLYERGKDALDLREQRIAA